MNAWQTNTFSNGEINAAGKILLLKDVSADEYIKALQIIEEWRTSHAYPLLI